MTIREALGEGKEALKASGIENPGLDTTLLLAQVLDTDRAALTASLSDELSEIDLIAFRGLITRRLGGECTAYILGRKEFMGLEFLVNSSVLVPRPETEILVETVLEKIKTGNEEWGNSGKKTAVLDLCTGSGAVAISLKQTIPGLEIWASDICAKALQTAKVNAARLLPEDSIKFCEGNLYEALFPIPQFHIIVSNPPYIPDGIISTLSVEVQKEPRLALDGGVDGLGIIRAIITGAQGFLNTCGMLILEADSGQMKTIAGLLEENAFRDIEIFKDLAGLERVICGIKT
jgi:release factor glutamine methyltransferase